jgi:hypothetical protein
MALFVLYGCNSHRAVDVVNASQETAFAQTESREVATGDRTEENNSVSAEETVEEKTTTIADYDTLGRLMRETQVRSVIGRRNVVIAASKAELRDSASVISSSSVSTEKAEEIKEKQTTDTDSRPVQGVEWLWIALGAAVVIGIIWVVKKIF